MHRGMLEEVRAQIEQLIARLEAVSAQNNALRLELQEHIQAEQALKARIAEMESEIDSLQFAKAFSAACGPEARAKVDSLIKDIDRCITALEEG